LDQLARRRVSVEQHRRNQLVVELNTMSEFAQSAAEEKAPGFRSKLEKLTAELALLAEGM
jgi:hypothetical protein